MVTLNTEMPTSFWGTASLVIFFIYFALESSVYASLNSLMAPRETAIFFVVTVFAACYSRGASC